MFTTSQLSDNQVLFWWISFGASGASTPMALKNPALLEYDGSFEAGGGRRFVLKNIWWYDSKNFPTYPWNIPQTPNQQFMKEFLSFGASGMPGVCSKGMLGFS